MPTDVPHLPFEGGLPVQSSPKSRRRSLATATPVQLPRPSKLLRIRNWISHYLPKWLHDYSVKLAVGLTLAALAAVWSFVYAPTGTELNAPPEQPPAKEAAGDWHTDILRAP